MTVRCVFLPARRSKRCPCNGNVSGWLGGRLAVCHSLYCIKTTKFILKLFRPSGSPIIEAFGTPCADTKFQGEPLHRGVKYTVVGKIGDFRRILPFISETVRDRPMSYYGTLIGSHRCRIEWYHFRWPWVSPNPGFKVTVYLQVEYLKKRCNTFKFYNTQL